PDKEDKAEDRDQRIDTLPRALANRGNLPVAPSRSGDADRMNPEKDNQPDNEQQHHDLPRSQATSRQAQHASASDRRVRSGFRRNPMRKQRAGCEQRSNLIPRRSSARRPACLCTQPQPYSDPKRPFMAYPKNVPSYSLPVAGPCRKL